MEHSPPTRSGNWNANVELANGAKHPACYNPNYEYYQQLIMKHKEHPLVDEIELITTGFAWWNQKSHREQLSDRLKAFEKEVYDEAYEKGKYDGYGDCIKRYDLDRP